MKLTIKEKCKVKNGFLKIVPFILKTSRVFKYIMYISTVVKQSKRSKRQKANEILNIF